MLLHAQARAGHEAPFYPSFYPQEIRIDALDPAAAAASWANRRVQAYVGDDLFAGGAAPIDATSVASLRSYLVLTFDAEGGPYAAESSNPQSRCAAARQILPRLAQTGGTYVFHPYPVTPYHADYLEESDLAAEARLQAIDARVAEPQPSLKIRAKGSLAQALVEAPSAADASDWDATLEEIDVPRQAGSIADVPPRPAPWIKQGWFQTYLLYVGHLAGGASARLADSLYRILVTGGYRDATERINLQRKLVTLLLSRCERVVVGYTVRNEYFNADYSSGVENVGFDSQTGLTSSVFPRTVKLKDFPWNGWLRLGIATKAAAAWNPVGGFEDAFGQLFWSTIADPALLLEPYGGRWMANRASVTPGKGSGPVTIPNDALRPEGGTGRLARVGTGRVAQQKLRYSVITSAFHDGTATGVADILYPYVFAFRWGVDRQGGVAGFDPSVARSASMLREWLAGFKVVGIETQTRNFGGDLKFSYRVPIVDVYLNHRSADAWEAASVAPPWSTVPWELIVLMEEAVSRGIAAFSSSEAQRRGVPWLDLVRDREVGGRLAALVDEFRQRQYRPAALKELVTPEEAAARWTALGLFYARHGHFLVTNGPYRLDSWTGDGVVLQVFRDWSYPLGVGSLDQYAIPLRGYVTKIEDRGDRIEIGADVEQVSRAQRSYEIERVAFAPPPAGADAENPPVCRYVIVAPNGAVARAGTAVAGKNGRFVVDLKHLGAPGLYTIAAAIFIGGNAVNPEIRLVKHRVTSAAALQAGEHSERESVRASR